MMQQILCMDGSDDVDLCTHLLAIAVVACRPITMEELASLANSNNMASLQEAVQLCLQSRTGKARRSGDYIRQRLATDVRCPERTGKNALDYAKNSAIEP
ncbi:hypothetical protein FALCPG4_001267 [Fusarium falciforme]